MPPLTVTETWSGPGRGDAVSVPLRPEENAAHPLPPRRAFEHWYFDARLDNGWSVIGFLFVADMVTGKSGVELHLYQPNGVHYRTVRRYSAAEIRTSLTRCEVHIGDNYVVEEPGADQGAVFHLRLAAGDLAFELTYRSLLPGWKPGAGLTRYGDTDFLAWVVPAPRAAVTGTVRLGETATAVSGVGYHDHNWGVADLKRILWYWYWGRLYTDEVTLLYAVVQTGRRYGEACSTPLMLAYGDRIVLSTGEITVTAGPGVFQPRAQRTYPAWLRLAGPQELCLQLEVQEVIDAHNFLDDVPVVRAPWLQPLAHRLWGRPGYFRFNSAFTLRVQLEGRRLEQQGTLLHEMIALR